MPSPYTSGTLVRCTITFTSASGTPVDPSTVTILVKDPTGAETTHSGDIVKDSTGVYHLDIDAERAGPWYYRGVGTGANQAAVENSFEILPSSF